MLGLPGLFSDCCLAAYLCIACQAQWCAGQIVRMQNSRKPSRNRCIHDDADQAQMQQTSAGS